MPTRLLMIILCALPLYTSHTASVAAQAPPYLGNRGAPPPTTYGNPATGSFQSQPGFERTGAVPGGMESEPSARIASVPRNAGMQSVTSAGGDLSSPTSADQGAAENSAGSIQVNNFVSILREGGVLMIPILFCSFVLVVFVFERLLFLRRGRVIPRPFVRGVIEQLEQQQLDQEEALQLCEQNGSPIAELFTAALRKWNRPAVEMEQAVVDAGAHITSHLRRYLRLFNAISNLTPLLGLLGTVLGMIDAFNSIAQADAMGRPELLASGIGAALLTTASGLCVAIPAYTVYVYFLGRTDKLILEMDSLVANVVELTCAEALQNSRSRGRSRKAA